MKTEIKITFMLFISIMALSTIFFFFNRLEDIWGTSLAIWWREPREATLFSGDGKVLRHLSGKMRVLLDEGGARVFLNGREYVFQGTIVIEPMEK